MTTPHHTTRFLLTPAFSAPGQSRDLVCNSKLDLDPLFMSLGKGGSEYRVVPVRHHMLSFDAADSRQSALQRKAHRSILHHCLLTNSFTFEPMQTARHERASGNRLICFV